MSHATRAAQLLSLGQIEPAHAKLLAEDLTEVVAGLPTSVAAPASTPPQSAPTKAPSVRPSSWPPASHPSAAPAPAAPPRPFLRWRGTLVPPSAPYPAIRQLLLLQPLAVVEAGRVDLDRPGRPFGLTAASGPPLLQMRSHKNSHACDPIRVIVRLF